MISFPTRSMHRSLRAACWRKWAGTVETTASASGGAKALSPRARPSGPHKAKRQRYNNPSPRSRISQALLGNPFRRSHAECLSWHAWDDVFVLWVVSFLTRWIYERTLLQPLPTTTTIYPTRTSLLKHGSRACFRCPPGFVREPFKSETPCCARSLSAEKHRTAETDLSSRTRVSCFFFLATLLPPKRPTRHSHLPWISACEADPNDRETRSRRLIKACAASVSM